MLLTANPAISTLEAVMTGAGQVLLAFSVVFALLNCFFGYKLIKVWAAIAGFLLGWVIGFFAALYFLENMGACALIGVVVGVLCGLAAHRLHHLRPQRHAAKPFGSLIAFEKIVHKAALCRHEVRQEQTEGHYQQYSFHDYSVFWLHSYNKHTIPNETAWQSGPAPLLNSGVMP